MTQTENSKSRLVVKRTNRPQKRQPLKKEDINLNILEKEKELSVEIKIAKLSEYDFPDKAKIYLEAHNRASIQHIELGTVQSFNESEKKTKPLYEFLLTARSTINFRVKIVDQETYHLLGLAEKLKEKKYTKSLLEIIPKEIPHIFEIDWDNKEHPIVYINKDIYDNLGDIKPLLAEVLLREILHNILEEGFFENDDEKREHKWIKMVNKYKSLDDIDFRNYNEKIGYINDIVAVFSKKHKIIEQIKYLRKEK